jgi:hypothetical protein
MLDRKLGGFISANPPAPTQASAQGVWDGNQQIVAQLQNAWPLPPHVVQRSLRFNSADSPSLSRTPGVASNRRTYTWSGWCKLTSLAEQVLFNAQANSSGGTQRTLISIASSGFLYVNTDNLNTAMIWTVSSNNLLRDFSAWYHIVVAVDTTQATAANRVRMYINGVEVSYAASTYPSQNYDDAINNTVPHYISYEQHPAQATKRLNGYLAEVNFVDGQALTPSSFGETDPQTGIWVPKRYTGTYGTNGFCLPFSNNSSTTALGFDASGNGNNWTPNNFSVTPGSGNDSLLDVPSLYGATDTGIGAEIRGNYATLNPLANNGGTLANGNLDHTGTTALTTSTIFPSTGKWYCEFTCTAYGGGATLGFTAVGVIQSSQSITTIPNSLGSVPAGLWIYRNDANRANNGASASYGSTWTANDVIGIAIDLDTGTLTFYKNGVSQGSAYTNLTGSIAPVINDQGTYSTSFSANFGQRPFAFPAPAGFKALCTTNFVAPAIGQTAANQADNHFAAIAYPGNGSTQNVVTEFAPDLVWIKNRSSNWSHLLYDTLRGPSNGTTSKALFTNGSDGENVINDNSTYGYLSAFNSNGFTVNAGSYVGAGGYANTSGQNYVAWCWNAGGNSVTNNAGSNGATIASTYRANKAAGFSVVTYTGNGVDGATVAHGLGAAPAFIIVKSRSNAFNWGVWHKNLAKYDANHAYAIGLNLTRPADATAQYAVFYPGVNTANVFGLGNESTANQSNATYVAYCFAEVPGFSGFGSYTGNGSADGPFVHLGFRPAFMLLKNISQAYGWQIYDSKRNPTNRVNLGLYPNVSNGEGTEAGAGPIDFLSNGFKIRDATWDELNGSTRTYLYIAFAESPFRLSSAR